MKSKRILFILVLQSALLSQAKTRSIFVDQVLKEAKVISTIKIFAYSDSIMYFGFAGSSDTQTVSCKSRIHSEKFREELIERKALEPSSMAGKWPDVGDSVLVVINKSNRIELFAKVELGMFYRFWDPHSVPFANSAFWINKTSGLLALETCKQINEDDQSRFWVCDDGCYTIRDKLQLRIE